MLVLVLVLVLVLAIVIELVLGAARVLETLPELALVLELALVQATTKTRASGRIHPFRRPNSEKVLPYETV